MCLGKFVGAVNISVAMNLEDLGISQDLEILAQAPRKTRHLISQTQIDSCNHYMPLTQVQQVSFQDLYKVCMDGCICLWLALIPDLNAPGFQMSTITECIGQSIESAQEE